MRRMKPRRALLAAQLGLSTCLALGAAASCGSRTGLLAEPATDAATEGAPVFDSPEEMPGLDTFRPDVPVINPCPDAAATLIYVVGTSGNLYSFNPGTSPGSFTLIGTISCPGT